MGQVSLVVELEIAPGQLEAFLDIVRPHGARALELEPGCLRFEVMLPRDEPGRVILVELYADDAAVEAHLGSDRMAAYREATGAMVSNRMVHRCDL